VGDDYRNLCGGGGSSGDRVFMTQTGIVKCGEDARGGSALRETRSTLREKDKDRVAKPWRNVRSITRNT